VKDIVEFINLRRNSFRNPCFKIEPLMDWVNWACANGAMFSVSSNPGTFDGLAIGWKSRKPKDANPDLEFFVNNFDPFATEYDVFVLDFFAENKETRMILIDELVKRNDKFENVWCLRKNEVFQISKSYINLFYKI